jgi:phosphomannomutase
MSHFPKRISSAELKLGCSDEQKFSVVEEVINRVKNMHGIKDIRLIDGVRANVSKNEWFLIRVSNTSPYLSVRLEAESNKELIKIAEAVLLLLKGFEFVDTSELKNLL